MIAAIAQSEPSAHWYTCDGEPAHFTVGANGKSRPTTLRDARGKILYPSVTSIIRHVWPAEELRKWRRSQDIMSAATTPRNGETDEQWVEKVLECADEISAQARAVGSRRHDLLHQFHQNQRLDLTSKDWPFIEPYIIWVREHVSEILKTEFIVVNREFGYAGTVDVLCRMKDGYNAIIDVKNRRKLRTYVEDILQLSAYQHALGAPAEIISIVLGTDRPEIHVEQWLGTDLAWKRFLLCFELWKESKEYNPISKTSQADDSASLPF